MVKKKINNYPHAYLQNPNPNKTKEEMWDILDGWSQEVTYEDPKQASGIDIAIPLPPLKYDGKVTKGIFFSQSADTIIEKWPKIKEIFIPIANSMFSSYPQSELADCFFTCYKNPPREKHWKKKHPDRKDVILIPLQDADWTNEYNLAPVFNVKKDTDVFCVTTPYPFKNIPMLAAALKMYELKYAKRLKVKYALGSKDIIKKEDGTLDYSKIRFDAKEQMDKVCEILGEPEKYIEFYPWIDHNELPKFYTRSRCCVLPSLIEGKNRFIQEAQSCNTPVVVFKDHNKFAKGQHPIIYKGSGEFAQEFNAESLADAIHKVLNNQEKYTPRRNYLKYFGRKNFINTLIDTIPYYRKNLPEYKKGRIQDNLWVDLAMQDNYQLSFIDFIYGKNTAIQNRRGIENMKSMIEFFFARFDVK